MRPIRRSFIPALAAALYLTAATPFTKKLSSDEKVLHALNRLTFGPRPGEVAQVKSIGLDKWIDRQLHPEAIAENPELTARIAPLETLRMTAREMVLQYPPPQLLRAIERNPALLPKDPVQRAAIERLAKRFRERKSGASQAQPELRELLTPEQLQSFREATTPEDRRAFMNSLPVDKRAQVLGAMARQRREMNDPSPENRRNALKQRAPLAAVAADLTEGKLLRALYSNRQLEEVLTDFWFNHFNVYLNKGADRFLVTSYERDAIRPHVFGKFKDLLTATAKHPAMLFYLDNWQSVDPMAVERVRVRRRANTATPRQRRGLNENYAREFLELHTLGVDGGYTQQDVIEVARCFTGWTIRTPQAGGEFFFNPLAHDRRAKTVLGKTIPAGGGIEDGLKVIEIAASHPSTARFISTKLAQRFVSDNPPKELIGRMAQTFLKTDGDLRAVLRTMFASREFFSEGAYRAKLKSPFEMVISAGRALDADVQTALTLAQRIDGMGQPLYRKEEPTGYSNNSDEWVNSAGLLARMNFALDLAGGKLPGVRVDTSRFKGDDAPAIARALLNAEASAQTREAIAKGVEGKQPSPALVAGLTVGSPDFQRR